MKLSVINSLLIAGFCVSLTVVNTSATVVEIPGTGMDIPKNGTGPGGSDGNSPTDDFFRLVNVVNAFDLAHPTMPLPVPIITGDETISSADVGSGGLTGFAYAVLHYGVGTGGVQASGGGEEVFLLNGATSFDFPANGSGPNGFGGFSGGVLYEAVPFVSTPESGMSGALMALISGIFALKVHFTRAKRADRPSEA